MTILLPTLGVPVQPEDNSMELVASVATEELHIQDTTDDGSSYESGNDESGPEDSGSSSDSDESCPEDSGSSSDNGSSTELSSSDDESSYDD